MHNQKNIDQMDEFIKNSNTIDLLNMAETVSCWDFNSALGNTICEKYHSLAVKLTEVSMVIARKGGKGYFWIICSPVASAILDQDIVRSGQDNDDYLPIAVDYKKCIGVIGKRWRVYVDTETVEHMILIGHDCKCAANDLGRVSIANFVV